MQTKEQLQARLEELQKQLQECEQRKNTHYQFEQAYKLQLNSQYGVFANKFFYFCNVDIAKAITLQSQNIIKSSFDIINTYIKDVWYKDVELHQKLGISELGTPYKVNVDSVFYGDTDSCFFTYQYMLDSIKHFYVPKEPLRFAHAVYKHRLKKYIEEQLDLYAKKFNTTNCQEFELEKMASSGIWIASKNYIIDIHWKESSAEDGIFLDLSKRNLKFVGIDVVKSSSTKFSRKYLPGLIEFIFDKKGKFTQEEFLDKIYALEKAFNISDVNDITLQQKISQYNKFVYDDQDKVVLKTGCPIHVRAAANYNWLIKNSKYRDKYQLLKAGDKVRYYKVKTKDPKENQVFGFIPDNFPHDVGAPQIDYKEQFYSAIISPMNRFLKALGYKELDKLENKIASLF